MYCPKCGVRNLEDAKFCRACGADLRLVPQAMTGNFLEHAPGEEQEAEGRKQRVHKPGKPPTLDKGFESIFRGIAFLILFLLGFVYFKNAFWIWMWFIIPGLEGIGKGIGQIIRARRDPRALAPFRPADALPANTLRELSAPATAEIVTPPASITEGTTRKLAERSRQ